MPLAPAVDGVAVEAVVLGPNTCRWSATGVSYVTTTLILLLRVPPEHEPPLLAQLGLSLIGEFNPRIEWGIVRFGVSAITHKPIAHRLARYTQPHRHLGLMRAPVASKSRSRLVRS